MADWIFTGEDWAYLSQIIVQFFGFGLGLGCVLWLVGAIVHVIADLVKY